MRKSNQETFNFFGRIYGNVRFNFSISVIGFQYMHWIVFTFSVKFVVEAFFFNKIHLSEVL